MDQFDGWQRVTLSTSFRDRAAAEEALATSPDRETRYYAVLALGKSASAEAVPSLAQALLADEDRAVRAESAGYLGSIKGPTAQAALLRAVNDPDALVRKKVLEALFRIDARLAQEAIDRATQDADEGLRQKATFLASQASKTLPNRKCPFLSEHGMCDMPGMSDFLDCSWEVAGGVHYRGCFFYQQRGSG
jgi:HEAT repeat protein